MEVVLLRTVVLRRSGAFAAGRATVKPDGGVSCRDFSVVPGDDALAMVTSNVVDCPAVVYAG